MPVPYSPGLEGVVAAETEISEVDGQNGRLIYRGGYLILDLANTCTFEEVAYLLWHGQLPDRQQLQDLGHAANLLYMMFGKEPDERRAHWIDQYLLLLADHGLNASTFATRVVA